VKRHPPGWTPAVGDIVLVRFLDHNHLEAAKSDGTYEFEVFGRIAEVNRDSYYIVVWDYADWEEVEREESDSNVMGFTIVRRAVLHICKLSMPRGGKK
jgi:hypothetical protein